MPQRGEIFISGVLCIFFGVFVISALAYTPDARLMPLAIGLPALLLSLMQLRQDFHRAADERMSSDGAVQLRPVFTMLLWFAAVVSGTLAIGIVPAGWLFVLLYLHFQHRAGLLFALFVSSGFAASIYLLVTVLLDVELPAGVVLELLNDG